MYKKIGDLLVLKIIIFTWAISRGGFAPKNKTVVTSIWYLKLGTRCDMVMSGTSVRLLVRGPKYSGGIVSGTK